MRFPKKPSQSSEFPKKKEGKKQSHEINQSEALNYKKGKVQKPRESQPKRKGANPKKVE
jgi:hypothetical protein